MSAAAAALAEQGIHADSDGLHLLPPGQAKASAELQEECTEFLNRTTQFSAIVADFVSVMESRATLIEAEKLRAIGLGNRVEAEPETRKRKALEMQAPPAMINEKKAQLDRLTAQCDSLARVDAEQKALLERLTNNES
ncbi:hypothetical protein EMIHUDRAFT_62728 [Emiliania huxleyi CCMP1516]|uniref:Intraflagellar transport protein 20 n=2 Tax=Emiliania huxleyi TaxID=2903 RepID=A0A0D3KUK1_EMIH1|nr:hypothetical protein EMIHUDRAFT_76663 [Emiliania huxleyi CCMP1516]XP_005791865.1 hypothetical protein EMIHUDRAFT_62728 [Emiliania huxleyi CCMP1516]EOD12712.1 hypothetical protein EMIHUDRAFT_76663 [Emiliania huxleyi CCMP1516]EOD39436.1 hypothetical protein EMIHUDRAFT_62728 [Emiliania huxleyi CCMP1516]|eukprot:XP_005765141.1 hypothetical protein EMIHUDRAFT_76663 [Emiliania huxleyi CCMP1516]